MVSENINKFKLSSILPSPGGETNKKNIYIYKSLQSVNKSLSLKKGRWWKKLDNGGYIYLENAVYNLFKMKRFSLYSFLVQKFNIKSLLRPLRFKRKNKCGFNL